MRVWDLESKFAPRSIASAFSNVWAINDSRLTESYDARCPITLETFEEPVMLEDGSVYEQKAVLDWLRAHDVAPCTNVPLRDKVVLRLAPLKSVVEHLLSASPKQRLERAVASATAAVCSGESLDVGSSLKVFRELTACIAEGAVELERWKALVSEADSMRRCLETKATLRVQCACRAFLAKSSLLLQKDRRMQMMAGSALQLQSRSRTFLAQQRMEIEGHRLRQCERSASKRCKAAARMFAAQLCLLRARTLRRRCQLSKQLMLACRGNDKLNLVKRLVEYRANVGAYIDDSVMFCIDGCRRLDCRLCDDGKEAPNFSCEPFCRKYAESDPSGRLVVHVGTQHDQETDAFGLRGYTALHYAAHQGHVEVVRFLYEAGARKYECGEDGSVPMRLAVRAGHVEVVRLLFEVGAHKDASNVSGWCPMHEAVGVGNVEVVRLLCEARAEIEGGGARCQTPLGLAVFFGHSQIARLLLDAGAQKDTLDRGIMLWREVVNGEYEQAECKSMEAHFYGAIPTKDELDQYGCVPFYGSDRLGQVLVVCLNCAATAPKETWNSCPCFKLQEQPHAGGWARRLGDTACALWWKSAGRFS